jgi:ABC-type Fe3+ transport system substrate-binding protein
MGIRMLTFEETMAVGQAEYQDVLDALAAVGLPASFTQTGGMNAAIEVVLDGGHALLVTDFEDSLAWSRAEHDGWSVGLYPPAQQYDGDVIAFGSTEGSGMDDLLELVQSILREAGRTAACSSPSSYSRP